MIATASEATPVPQSDLALLDRPPEGCWLRWEPHGGVAGASERSWVTASLLLAFSALWNGILWQFVGVYVAWALRSVGITPPGWMPAERLEGGGEWLLGLFLIPFVAASGHLTFQIGLALAGKTEVGRSGPDAWIRRSVGPLGWKRRFAAAEVHAVRLQTRSFRDSDGDARETTVLEVDLGRGGLRRVGGGLKPERRAFLCVAARRVLGV